MTLAPVIYLNWKGASWPNHTCLASLILFNQGLACFGFSFPVPALKVMAVFVTFKKW
jgi:hypothetical protein